MRDLYKILGVTSDADFTIIKRRYRELARELHPDRTGGDKAKERKFQEVAMAYAILSNESRRAAYDRQWEKAPVGTPGTLFGRDFDDIIEKVQAQGLHPDNLVEVFGDIVEFAHKFQGSAPEKVQQAAQQISEQSDGSILGALETIFGVLNPDNKPPKKPSKKARQ